MDTVENRLEVQGRRATYIYQMLKEGYSDVLQGNEFTREELDGLNSCLQCASESQREYAEGLLKWIIEGE